MMRLPALAPVLSTLVLAHQAAVAQPVPDDTVGTQITVLGPNILQIDGGTPVGQNLFHSFESFNVEANNAVFFFSPDRINNIFSRVTGISVSEINGILGTVGSNADLFFLNPNGVFFGPEASLDVQGSFVVSTANAIGLGTDGVFSATEPALDQLLAVNPSAFFFNNLGQPGEIISQSAFVRTSLVNPSFTTTGLQVPNGEALILLGGNINVDSGQLNALGGRVEIGAVSGKGEVSFSAEEQAIVLPDRLARANISFNNTSFVSAVAGDGGDIVIQANDVSIENASLIAAGIAPGLGELNSVAGDVLIDATGTVSVSDASAIGGAVFGAGTGSDIDVSAQNIQLSNGSQISTIGTGVVSVGNVSLEASDTISFTGRGGINNTASGILSSFVSAPLSLLDPNFPLGPDFFFGQGDGGSITLVASDINLEDGALISSSVFIAPDAAGNFDSSGNSGNISIDVDNLSVIEGSSISSNLFGSGSAGNISIEASGRGFFDGTNADELTPSGISSTVTPNSEGTGGNVTIAANTLEVVNGAQLNASTLGIGNAGNVVIDVEENIVLDGTSENELLRSGAGSEVGVGAEGTGGNVEVSASTLEITNGAVLSASTSGVGDAGNVVIDVDDSVVFDGTSDSGQFVSNATSEVGVGAEGAGGNVEISANTIEVANGAALNASTSGTGDAGNVLLDVQESIVFEGTSENGQFSSGAFSIVAAGAQGIGGNVEVSATTLEIANGAVLNASTLGTGSAGDVVIDVEDSVVFDGTSNNGQFRSGAGSEVGVGADGAGGNVEVMANTLEVKNGAVLSALTLGTGNAGNVIIDVEDSVVFSDGSETGQFISAATTAVGVGGEGDGGNVAISTNILELTNGAQLLALTFGTGDAGEVIVNAEQLINIEGFLLRGEEEGNPSGIFTINGNLSETGTGRGGDIQINTSQFLLKDGATIDARTFNDQPGGDIDITVGSLELLQGSQIISASDSSGSAGTIQVDANDSIKISGIDINFAERIASFPDLENFVVPQSNISVRSSANGSAGDIILNAPMVTLDEQGQLIAESATVDGGNIILDLDNLLLLRNESLISATAGTAGAGGNGGNITITVPFIVAIPDENSDITANASEGAGGQVIINAQGVFGIEPRSNPTPLSDITASSAQGPIGVVAINSLDTDFIQNNLTDLPDSLVDTETLVANSCVARSQDTGGTFEITGSNTAQAPNDIALSNYPTGQVASLDELGNNPVGTSQPNTAVIEPQSIYQLANGRLVLSRECS